MQPPILKFLQSGLVVFGLFAIGFEGPDIGDGYSTTGWAAILSPFFIGMVADRFFAAEKVLGFLHLAGAACLWWAAQAVAPGAFFWVLLLYALCYMPTLALVNTITIKNYKLLGNHDKK